MMELTTYTELEIAHRLMTAYTQKCTGWHGHRYEVEITVTSDKLNDDGMIVDFKKLKEVVKAVLDDQWDHGACVRANDPLASALMEDAHHERVHVIDANPTLEWMVSDWAASLDKEFESQGLPIHLVRLKASETARNTVTWYRDSSATEPDKHDDSTEEDRPSDDPDARTYMVSFTADGYIHTGVYKSSHTGKALYDDCLKAAVKSAGMNPHVILTSIQRL